VKLIDRLAGSAAVRVVLTLAAYAVYAAVLGASLVPPVALGTIAFRRFAAGGQGLGGIAMFCPCAAGSRILCPAGMSPHRVHEIEHGHGTRRG
jgi:hypothetical protein